MAWHHVIPFALLRDVWNRLVAQHVATELPEARVAIRQYLLLSDRTLHDIDALIGRIRAGNIDQRRASHHRLEPLTVVDVHRLGTAVTWPAWNTVEGPANRSDDPQNDPRRLYFDRFTSGLTAEEAVRMSAVESLFGYLRTFVNAGPAPVSHSLRSLSQAVSHARPVLICDAPVRYRPEMWIKDSDGRWRKRNDGQRYNAASG
jgi:hypothetical protein